MTNNVRLLINELKSISNLRVESWRCRPVQSVRLANGYCLAVVRPLDGAGISTPSQWMCDGGREWSLCAVVYVK